LDKRGAADSLSLVKRRRWVYQGNKTNREEELDLISYMLT